MDINKFVEARMKTYADEGDALRTDWKELLGKVNEARALKGEAALDENMERNMAILFENTSMDTMLKGKGSMLNETMYSVVR